MKSITFSLTLKFTDKISSDNDIKEIANNIASALRREATEYGLSPDGYDGSITDIEVTEKFSGAMANEIIC